MERGICERPRRLRAAIGEGHELLLAVDVRLLVDVADVGFRGAFRNVELFLEYAALCPFARKNMISVSRRESR